MANLPSTPLPSSRSITYGDFPVKTFMSQSGIEYRIKYGTKRAGMVLSLTYKNITDSEAETFLDHYHGQSGTFERFNLSDATRDADGKDLTMPLEREHGLADGDIKARQLLLRFLKG